MDIALTYSAYVVVLAIIQRLSIVGLKPLRAVIARLRRGYPLCSTGWDAYATQPVQPLLCWMSEVHPDCIDDGLHEPVIVCLGLDVSSVSNASEAITVVQVEFYDLFHGTTTAFAP